MEVSMTDAEQNILKAIRDVHTTLTLVLEILQDNADARKERV
jgi:hypothetical protein